MPTGGRDTGEESGAARDRRAARATRIFAAVGIGCVLLYAFGGPSAARWSSGSSGSAASRQ
jgi:hypothetical protein